jgi:hypothetical protein
MILLILLLIPTLVYADFADWFKGYQMRGIIDNCECEDTERSNVILRNEVIRLENQIRNSSSSIKKSC